VRLLVEREREINAFQSVSYFKVTALFEVKDPKGTAQTFPAYLSGFRQLKKHVILEKCKNASFRITEVTTKPSRKSPPPPFTTSTLQQEASRKLGFSVSQTMTLAQKLYEAGKITYMRTDSVNLSDLALNVSKKVITDEFGNEYSHQTIQNKNKKESQEAMKQSGQPILRRKPIPRINARNKNSMT
jgi:DNA topoisomerase-1